MSLRFGTDGIRGVANADLTPELVLALGRAAARVLPAPCFVVGRDTRRSGALLQAALSAGLAAEGADVVDVGVLPTPGVAWLARSRQHPAAVVSASHNPFPDNGVKIFAAGGTKLPHPVEEAIEAELEQVMSRQRPGPRPPTGHGVGQLTGDPEAAAGYVDHLVGLLGEGMLEGLRLVVDCANGAAAEVAPEVLRRLGAEVTVLAGEPNGTNINVACGSTHPAALAEAVVGQGADLGLALDGDADRLLAVDASGAVATGDHLLALFATDLAARGRLAGNTVVVTVMSNLGLRLALAGHGIIVRETPVGDRHVLEALDADGLSLGGEQSGHIVFREISTTGDGILTGLLLADLVRRRGCPLGELLAGAMQWVPQVLVNVAVDDPSAAVADPAVRSELSAAEERLGGRGRVVLRASGTEPLVRVMVEIDDEDLARSVAEQLAEVVAAGGARFEAVGVPPAP